MPEIVEDVEGVATKQIGPLPAWGWAAVAVGGVVAFRFFKGGGSPLAVGGTGAIPDTGATGATSSSPASGVAPVGGTYSGGGGSVDTTALENAVAQQNSVIAALAAAVNSLKTGGAKLVNLTGDMVNTVVGGKPAPVGTALPLAGTPAMGYQGNVGAEQPGGTSITPSGQTINLVREIKDLPLGGAGTTVQAVKQDNVVIPAGSTFHNYGTPNAELSALTPAEFAQVPSWVTGLTPSANPSPTATH